MLRTRVGARVGVEAHPRSGAEVDSAALLDSLDVDLYGGGAQEDHSGLG